MYRRGSTAARVSLGGEGLEWVTVGCLVGGDEWGWAVAQNVFSNHIITSNYFMNR